MAAKDLTPLAYRSFDTAKLLDVSVTTLNRWRWKCKGPRYSKLDDRTYAYTREDLLQFL